jgi:DNA helicase-2/ATP-dependent DNA helicase PcrA
MDLTRAQRDAIAAPPGNLQLIACAGSGKTEVVALRVATLLDPKTPGHVDPGNIVAFTFTDKAAAELKDRIITRTRERLGNVTGLAEIFVGTIHAFCLDLLTSEVPEYLKYTVLNEVQESLLIDRNSRKSGLTNTTDLAGKPLKRYVDTKRYRQALSILREGEVRQNKLVGSSIMVGLAAYKTLLNEKRYFDYSAILELAVDALKSHADLKRRLRARVRHVIVDEYQDVNPVQEEVVRLLAGLGAHICVVGDDDQTIYQWRGSDVRNILTFKDRYAKVRQIALNENFRSSEGIVETARAFIEQNPDRLPKKMAPAGAQLYEPGDIVGLWLDDEVAEAEFIARTLKAVQGVAFMDGDAKRGLAWSDCAILLRSVQASAAPILHALTQQKIPYIVGGMNDLFGTAEVQAARILFYFIAGRADITSGNVAKAWKAANLGLTPKALARGLAFAEKTRQELDVPEDQQERWGLYNIQRTFLAFLEAVELREETISGEEWRREVVLYNLGKFSQVISDFEAIHFHSAPKQKYDTFAKFLEHQADGSYPEGWQANAYANPNAVRIMTVHQAKGMQWPAVFVPQLVKNRFPSRQWGGRNVWHILLKDAIPEQARYEGGVEDERRLFYVAITRSRKFLFVTGAPVTGNQMFQKRSEFLDAVFESKFVKRREPDFSKRKHLEPEPAGSIANVVLSFSDLKYFFECPYQFKLRILYGFNAPLDEALGYGKSLHDALHEVHQEALEGTIATGADVPRLLGTHMNAPYAYPKLREQLTAKAERVLKDYLSDNRDVLKKLEFTEKAIEISLEDGITVKGRIDLVRRTDTDETTIVDFKSTNRAQAEAVTETQLHIYALGYQELTGRRADKVEIYELDERARKPRAVDDDFIADVRRDVRRAAEALRKNDMPTQPHVKRCPTCDYCGMCSAAIRN